MGEGAQGSTQPPGKGWEVGNTKTHEEGDVWEVCALSRACYGRPRSRSGVLGAGGSAQAGCLPAASATHPHTATAAAAAPPPLDLALVLSGVSAAGRRMERCGGRGCQAGRSGAAAHLSSRWPLPKAAPGRQGGVAALPPSRSARCAHVRMTSRRAPASFSVSNLGHSSSASVLQAQKRGRQGADLERCKMRRSCRVAPSARPAPAHHHLRPRQESTMPICAGGAANGRKNPFKRRFPFCCARKRRQD